MTGHRTPKVWHPSQKPIAWQCASNLPAGQSCIRIGASFSSCIGASIAKALAPTDLIAIGNRHLRRLSVDWRRPLFTMWGIRASFLPAVPGTSAFHELNVRTYVHHRGVPSVWFLSLDAANRLAVWGARTFYHLPYFNARMSLVQTDNTISYSSVRKDRRGASAEFHANWSVGETLPAASPASLEFFLTERYCLDTAHNGKLYRALIHHQPWPLQKAELNSLESTMIESHGLPTLEGEPLLHYCEALSVEIWRLKEIQTE